MKPVGNGLYKFSDYTLVKEMNLVASKNFNTSPLIPKVNVIISDDEETSLNALEHNVIDALTVDTSKLGKRQSAHQSMHIFHSPEYCFVRNRC